MTSDAPLIDRLRSLCALAEQSGCDRIWLASVADDLVALVLAQMTLRSSESEPRSVEAAEPAADCE